MHALELSALRRELGLTQAQMAAKLGIKRGQVAKLEAGDCEIRGAVKVLLEQMVNTHPS